MDIHINPVSGATPTYQPPAVKAPSNTPAPANDSAQVPVPVAATPIPATTSTVTTSQAYEAAARQAALSFKDVYALGDQNFSIFKDATGKYITRYVSLRDGKVTYTPAPTFVRQAGAEAPARVAISA